MFTPGLAMSTQSRSSGLTSCVAYTSHACGVDAGFSNILTEGGSMAGVPGRWNAVVVSFCITVATAG
jgi:hypothetical protein